MYFEYFKITDEEKRERAKIKLEPLEVWYKPSSSFHKIVVHLKEMIDACPVAPGLTSEEAYECNNEKIRKLLKLTRKSSWLKMLKDLVSRMPGH